MRILSVVRKCYYGSRSAVEPMSVYFTLPLREMGHEVDVFDHYETNCVLGKDRCTEELIAGIRKGNFDVVFYQTSGTEPIHVSALADLSRRFCIAAWNSDDDWQWQITRKLAPYFTYMITTYPAVYESNRQQYPNLLLSQWGALGSLSDFAKEKDIDFSFVGAVYKSRSKSCRYLKRRAGLVCYGIGSRLVRLGLPYFRGASRISPLIGRAIDFGEMYQIWNRTRVSFTPLEGGPAGNVVSIKGRVFEMGLSGTLMLCQSSAELSRYYEPDKEFVTFDSIEDCAEKAHWYLAHEDQRARIARNYRDRTSSEHLWTYRFRDLFARLGLETIGTRKRAPVPVSR